MMKVSILISLLIYNVISVSAAAPKETFPYQIKKQTIDVRILPQTHSAEFENRLVFNAGQPVNKLSFLINKKAKISRVESGGRNLPFQLLPEYDLSQFTNSDDTTFQEEYQLAGELQINLPRSVSSGEILLNYQLSATDSVDNAAFSREYIAYQVKGYIGDKGVFISPAYFWYPTLPQNLSNFYISVTTPESLLIVTQGRLNKNQVEQGEREIEWEVNYPASSLHLVGSEFITGHARYNNTEVYTFFFPQSRDLEESYLKACQRYLGMYEKMIGPYPFSKFAVVENFFPTGYGMPSYTLLGSQVIRLPFIIYTSLGHEIAHNWWGNSVYVDYDSGNWCEGLTTYFADHYYKESSSEKEAAQYRQDINRDFTVYVKDNKDFPLSKFEERTESSSRAIGYGKSAMVFHQLRKIIGDSLFFRTFQQFYRNYQFKDASWQDIIRTASEVTGQDLDWFFGQWLNRKGAPEISLGPVNFQDRQVSVTLSQKGEELYRLYVPLKIVWGDSTEDLHYIWLEKPEQNFTFKSERKPYQVQADPDFDVFRKLDRQEIPPTLAEIYAQEKAMVVLPDRCPADKQTAYREFVEKFIEGEDHYEIREVSEIDPSIINTISLYLLGTPAENSIIDKLDLSPQSEIRMKDGKLWIDGSETPQPDDLSVMVARTSNPSQNVCIISLGANHQTGRVANLLSHYGKYSYLIFTSGKNRIKGTYSVTNSPMIVTLP